jgi:hypothetical protein
MLGGQDQHADNGSNALQAGRDIIVHQTNNGLSVADVRELVAVFVRDHLPMLRQVAQQEAQENAKIFVEKFLGEIVRTERTAVLEELQRPAAQAVFVEATIGAAKRGTEMDLDLLVKALIERLDAPADSVLRYVSEDAATVLPKLSGNHIAFLGFCLLLLNLQFTAVKEIAQLEQLYAAPLQLVKPGMALAIGHREYLAGLGLISINTVADGDAFASFMNGKYPFFKMDGLLNGEFPVLAELYASYKSILLPAVSLTATGKLIACLFLQRSVPVNPAVFIPDA